MGATVSVRNETPYTWNFSTTEGQGYQRLDPGRSASYTEWHLIWRYIYFRYENNQWVSLSYVFNTFKGNPTFTLRETGDRSQISLSCTTESETYYCPNYGKIKEDNQRQEQQRRRQEEEQRRRQEEEQRRHQEEQRRRQEEEQRRRQEEEQRRRQEEEQRRRQEEKQRRRQEEEQRQRQEEKQRRRQEEEQRQRQEEEQRRRQEEEQRRHQEEERTQVLHQQTGGDAAAIERDEVVETEKDFEELLSEFEILEDEGLQGCRIEDRMKTLQDELAVRYCREKQLPIHSMFTFEQMLETSDLSLTEKLNVLQAVLNVTLNDAYDPDEDRPVGWEKKYDFLFRLVEELYIMNPSLAEDILLNILDSVSKLSPESKEILGHMLFNQIWTPTDIMLFIRQSSDVQLQQIESVLLTARTYHVDLDRTTSALRKENPVVFLQECIHQEKEKDAKTIMHELCQAKCPENISALVQDVLIFLESKLPKCVNVDLTETEINSLKKKIQDLDLKSPDIDMLKDILTGMSLAVKNSTSPKYFPRLTQLASLLLLLLSQQMENKGCLLEIGTGEGKSCILAMFATIMAIRGIKVDIATSSSVLARRDQEEWRKFLDLFKVTSSVVPPPVSNHEEPDKLVKAAYQQQIVYGTVGAFAADTLKQEFEKRTTRGGRPFELVIVDEVDYMTLDNGVQVTFLSHESSGLRHIEQVLASIWAMVSSCQRIEMSETGEIKWVTRMQYFHKAITAAVVGQETSNFSGNDILCVGVELGIFTQEDVDTVRSAQETKESDTSYDDNIKAMSEIMKKVSVPQQYDLMKIFEKVLEDAVRIKCYSLEDQKAQPWHRESEDHEGQKIEILLLEGGLACEIMSEESLIKAITKAIKSSIKYSKQIPSTEGEDKCMGESEGVGKSEGVVVPTFLENYIENQLPVFIRNALQAVTMCQGREYMIDISAAAERKMNNQEMHEYYAIIPVDFRASGILEKNKKWGNGLQQFLEFKHRLAVSPFSNVTNYMSNFHYFKRYISSNGIFGVSGTLGSTADRDFLVRHYKTNTYTVPAHRRRRVVELPAVQVNGGDEEWFKAICGTASKASERGQVTLIICEDVKTANKLHEKLKQEGQIKPDRITLYTISERHNVEREKFGAGRVIIATNLGGRGTDIKLEDGVNQSGGLFVLLTHFPHNRRVERQILGRTGRKGNPGMFQMVLNLNHLDPAYQNQSVEIMRHLREEYEVKRIQDMESDELVVIDLKEKLFGTLCRFLKDFDKHYTDEERQGPLKEKETWFSKLPKCFTTYCPRFDYHPAINALKESWALWLTLHETEINNQEDFDKLESDLLKYLNETSEELQKGQRENFYDHIRQAVVRTDLHFQEKTKKDFGAKSYWEKVETSDPRYKAVALYNQAYITINLAQGDYRADAKKLLLDAKEAIHAYVCEVSNTMTLVDLSVTEKFTKDDMSVNNFQSQMTVRMNIFQSWMNSIIKAVAKLDELVASNSDGTTEECSVYSLSEEKNFITTNEMTALYDIGLGFVFEVKQKPKFCFDALICFFLGVLQVFAGVLICALSLGSASQFGLGLISEGVSDMISGTDGMINGTFSWASWAISKAISIGISLLTAGFSAIKKAASSVYKVTKGLLNGTKSFTSVASDIIKSGKAIISSCKSTISSGILSLTKQSFTSLMTSTALKQNLKHATKYATQEIIKQSVITSINYAADKGLQELFKKIFKSVFEEKVILAVKENTKLNETITRMIVSKADSQKQNFKINKDIEKQLKERVDSICGEVIHNLIWNLTTAHEVISRISEVWGKATELMEKMKLSGIHKAVTILSKITDCTIHFTEILKNVPTKQMIDDKFVPDFLRITRLQKYTAKNDQDDEHKNFFSDFLSIPRLQVYTAKNDQDEEHHELVSDFLSIPRLQKYTAKNDQDEEHHEFVSDFLSIPRLQKYTAKNDQDEEHHKFVPDFLSIPRLQKYTAKNDQDDERHKLDVQRLKAELLDKIAQAVSDQFLSACSEHMTSIITKAVKDELNQVAGKAVDQVTRRNKTQRFFYDQSHKHKMRSASDKTAESLSDEDREQLKKYTDEICNPDRPASALDIYILTNSKLLNGKGIQLSVVDEHGNRLSEEHYPGTNRSAKDLKLRLTRYSKDLHENKGFFGNLHSMVFGKSKLYSGHFDIVQEDGTIIRIRSEDQNCFYHAVAQATNAVDPKQEALNLRQGVKDEVQGNPVRYARIVNLQRRYERSHGNPGKYTISGGTKEEIKKDLKRYEDICADTVIDERDSEKIREYNLGFFSKYKNVTKHRKDQGNSKKGVCNADHIPPKSSVSNVLNNTESPASLHNTNPELHTMLTSSNNNQQNLFSMEVLTKDHKSSLTTGASKHADASRKILENAIVSGDGERLLKECMILHHPLSSDLLRADLGRPVPQHHQILSKDGVRSYYKVGFLSLVDEYSDHRAIDQNQRDRLREWVNQNQYENTNGEEYQSILQRLNNNN